MATNTEPLPTTFFKVMMGLQDCVLPPQFSRLYGDRLPNPIKLTTRYGRQWIVHWERNNEHHIVFRQGWTDFVQHYCIKFGFFLTFTFDGSDTLSVKVFALSGCEIRYLKYDNRTAVQTNVASNQGNEGGLLPGNCLNTCKHARGQEVADNFKSPNDFFVFYITQPLLSLNMLVNVPTIGTANTPRYYMVLRFRGREWNVQFTKYNHNQLGCLGVGWNSFKTEIGLQPGMVAIFEVVKVEQPQILEVHLF